MRDHDDDSQQTPNPFRRRPVGRFLRRRRRLVARRLRRATRPLRAIGRVFGRGADSLARGLEDQFRRVGRGAGHQWRRLGRRVPVDSVRRQVSSLKDTAARSVDDLTFSVREHTTHSSWMRRLRARLAAIGTRIRYTWLDFLAWAERSWFTRVITAPLRWLTRASHTIGDFMVGWVWTRQYRHLLFGIPAILLVMPLAYCAVRLPFYTPQAKARHYRRAANEALAAADYNSAELYFRKLAQLGDVHEQVTWRAALLAEEQGELDEAYRQMRQIAPLNEPGMPEAHLWIAQRITFGDLESDNPQAQELIEQHVRHAMARQSAEPIMNVLLARVYFSTGRLEEAESLLDKTRLTDLPWRARVGAADLYAQLGQLERGRALASGAVAHFNDQQLAGAELTVDDYLSWAAAVELEGHTGEAVEVLFTALEAKESDAGDEATTTSEADAASQRLHEAIADLGMAHFDNYPVRSTKDWDARLQLLERLLPVLPDPEPALQRLVQLTMLPEVSERAEGALQIQQQAGPLPAAVEKTRGDVAIIKGDLDEAREHYQLAVDRDPNTHSALNNLAYLMANREPIDLQQAMTLADRAVELEPENPHYLETRGQILIQLGRWPDAVADLTIALNGMPTKREIHTSLARAYEELGEHETARLHAAQAGE
jgi:tetratricopeptide (TPR) repeat protein